MYRLISKMVPRKNVFKERENKREPISKLLVLGLASY
jgi:hypothetical protein